VIDTQDKVNLVWRFEVLSPYMNTKLVKQEDVPGSWKDLLDPKWAGKMSLGDPNIQSTFSRVAVVFMENGVWNEDYVKALYKQKPGFTTGGADDFSRLSRGEVSLVICGAEATAAKFIVEGAPIQPIDMRDGVVFSTGSMAAIAGSPNPNATKVFINWVLSQEGQTVTSKAQSIKVLRKDVADFRAKGAQVQYTRPLVESIQHLEKSTRMFQEKWFDKLVGR
ncbi:MAG: extracellular solute-binding protein, partial [Dehalococcoidia bacterium]|nr:extracellular solute-binding protein [Dehalococcoidia bacterium]